jgi:hypothetical protein
MDFERIACLDDLTREAFWPAKEFIYDLIRVPVWHAAGLDIAKSPRQGQRHNLAPGFRVEDFLSLCGLPGPHWSTLYHRLPAAAEDHLRSQLPPDTLFIGYEMTPALTGLLSRAGRSWLDIRLGPLRFGTDLHLGLATNDAALHARLLPHALSAQQVLTEACLLSAQVRYRRRYDPQLPRLDDALVWIGQTAEDASLIDDTGHLVRLEQFEPQLRELSQGRRVLYRGHPLAGDFAANELAQLQRICGQQVQPCELDTYELLAMDDDVAFVGLSSGVLQEAEWFGKQALALHPPLCQPAFDEVHDPARHLMVASNVFMSEPLWSNVLDRPLRPGAVVLPARPNHLRELVNTWWGFATVQLRHSSFHRELLALHGAAAPAAASPAPADEGDLLLAHQRIDSLRQEVEGLKEALRVVLRQTTLRETMLRQPASA